MDEFGKGTMTEVGLSLLASSLNYWLSKGKDHCPHIFASSHFHSLRSLLDDTDLLSFHTLDVHQNGDELEFQYKLVDGIIDNSYASYTALKNGISREIVDRSNEVYEHLKSGKSLLDVPQQNPAAEQQDFMLAQRMDDLMATFLEWDLTNDPLGFLKIAKEALSPDDDKEEDAVQQDNDEAAMEDNGKVILEEEEVVVLEEKEVVILAKEETPRKRLKFADEDKENLDGSYDSGRKSSKRLKIAEENIEKSD
uniref:DNA mismatch repair proteins mutS family domain-containing protein n=1 Tax=Panagrolaimus davidi TaxID=227884 RepID=A0A914PYD7_9BILA